MNCFLFSAICFVLVESHPLTQNIQPYLVTNNQQYVYQEPCSEAFIVQPSKINQYSQPVSIQTSLPTYQNLQGSVTDQLTKIYLENILSNPSLRQLLVPNKIGNEYSNLIPYNNREFINNYIIVPPDDLKVNHTVSKQRKPKRVKNDAIKDKGRIKETNTSHKRMKKLRGNEVNSQNIKSLNKKTRRKGKQKAEQSWSFDTDNIKCFTPADVLANEKYVPEKRTHKEVKNQCQRKNSDKTSKLSANNKNVNGSYKHKKPKKCKAKKKRLENGVSKCQKKTENISSVTPTKTKSKQCTTVPKACKCTKKDKLPDCDTKITEDTPQTCNQDMNELFLSNVLQQGCINLENRCTRNSKADTVIKDFHSMYPDLPSDISKSLASYMNDFFSPHSLQNTFNSAPGNKYPFDFSQLYQIPQYPNINVNKAKGNTETSKKTKRKKKKKKKNTKPKAKKENVSNNDDINIQTSEKNSQIFDNAVVTKTNTQILESNIRVSNETIEIETHIPYSSSETDSESAEKTQDISEEIQTIDITPVSPKKNTTDTVIKELIIPIDGDLQNFPKPVQTKIEIIKEIQPIICDTAVKTEEEFKEIYETQIPNSIPEGKYSDNNFEALKHDVRVINQILPIVDSNINQFSEWGSDDELFNMFLHDYYPDFRADNFAYLVSNEETDLRNIHDRYFYVTDRNIDSREIYSPKDTNHLYNTDRVISTEDQLGNHDKFQHRDNENIAKEKDKEEVVFRTPPGLDVPDFITRKVNIDKEDSNEIYYRHNLDDNFDRFNLDNFADNTDNLPKTAKSFDDENSGRVVETVYARSKVVKYGQGQEIITTDKPQTKTNSYFNDDIIQNDGDKFIVIAKSLHPEDYW